jgi:hypothetical protein
MTAASSSAVSSSVRASDALEILGYWLLMAVLR